MVNLIGNFSRLDRKKVLIAGDLMLDTYTIGKAKRISPEAPVAVVEVLKSEERAGGAGNAILNLISMGADVVALGRVGSDIAGQTLKTSLVSEGVDIQGIIEEEEFTTPIKNRIIADGQQIVRVDHETIIPLSLEAEEALIQKLPILLKDVQTVAISDYGKGFLSDRLLKELISQARALNIFIIADPKGTDFKRYSHVNLIKPNLKEAYLAAHMDARNPLDEAAVRILASTHTQYLMVTRSEDGISLFENGSERKDFPVTAKEVKDVTGAGDTVLAMLAISIANGLPLPVAIHFANVAASIAIEQFGCARITLPQLAKRLLEIDASNKIFDADHIHALQAALKDHPCSLVSLSGNTPPTSQMVHELASYKKMTGHSIMAAIQGKPDELVIGMLAALYPIDYILLNTKLQLIQKSFPGLLTVSTGNG